MPVDLPDIIDVNVVLVGSVVLLENCCYLFLILVQVWLRAHRLHELVEADATRLLNIELGNYLIHSLFVGGKTVLGEQQSEVIGQKDAHTRGVVCVEYLFKVDNVLDF